jgi:hypothetical protein
MQPPGYGAGRMPSNNFGVIMEKITAEQKQNKRKRRNKTAQIWYYIKI